MYGVKGEVPDGDYIVPIGKSVLAREGRHLTVVTYSRMVHLSLQAAEILAKKASRSRLWICAPSVRWT